jgi:hypothetical protein
MSYLNGDADSIEMWELLNFFETIGLLLRRRYLNCDDVWEMMSYYVFPLYWSTKAIVEKVRNEDGNTLSNFEYLYAYLAKAEKKHHGISPEPSSCGPADGPSIPSPPARF